MYVEQKKWDCLENKLSNFGQKAGYHFIVNNLKLKTIRQRGKMYQISQIPEMSRNVGKIRYGLGEIGGRRPPQFRSRKKSGRAVKRSLFNKKFK